MISRNFPQLQESGLLRLGKVDPYKPVDIFIDEYLTVCLYNGNGRLGVLKISDLRSFYGFRRFVILMFLRHPWLLFGFVSSLQCTVNYFTCEVVEYIRVCIRNSN